MPARGRISYEMLGIASVLSHGQYKVPIYQRSYAWEDGEIDDFWADLRHALDNREEDYFLGTLVLTPSDDPHRITVIDGQQRLATTSLLLAAIRDIWKEWGETDQADDIHAKYLSVFDRRAREYEPRLTLNEDDDDYYRELVVAKGSPSEARDSHYRMLAARKALGEALTSDLDSHGKRAQDRLISWLDFLDHNASVITVTVPTEADAFVIFETLNDRGAQLTIGDLLKNYLFMRSGNRLDAAKTSWIQALAALDVSAENDIFVTFLRHHWSSMFGAVRERELYEKIKEEITTPAQAVRYAKELAQAAQLYAALQSPSHEYWLTRGFTSTTKANIETLLKLELEQNRPLLLAVMAHFSKPELRKTLQALVRWSVRGLIVGGIGGGRTERAYCEAAMKVRSGAIKTTVKLLKELLPIVPDDKSFEDSFRRARQTKARISRYLLLALERQEQGETEAELVPNSNEDEVNLEHILPRNAEPKDWLDFAPEEIPVWSQRIGNHCLLKKSENGAIGNQSWPVKEPVLTHSSLVLTQTAAKAKKWDKDAIDRRQKKLAKLAVETWPR